MFYILLIRNKFTLFADVTSVSLDMDKVKEWWHVNFLALIIRKTNNVSFKGELNNVFLGNEVIIKLTVNTFLGLHFDKKLNGNHTVKQCKRLALGCYYIRVVSNEINLCKILKQTKFPQLVSTISSLGWNSDLDVHL